MKYRIQGDSKLFRTGMAAAMHYFCSGTVVVLKPGEYESTWFDIFSGKVVIIERISEEIHPCLCTL